jgi:hypothetical protein
VAQKVGKGLGGGQILFETLQSGRLTVVHQEVGNGRVEPTRAAGLQRLGHFLPRAGPLIEAAQQNDVATIVTPYCRTGPARARLDRAEPALNAAGIHLYRILRPYDALSWPHAKAGYFGLRKQIPSILRSLKLTR